MVDGQKCLYCNEGTMRLTSKEGKLDQCGLGYLPCRIFECSSPEGACGAVSWERYQTPPDEKVVWLVYQPDENGLISKKGSKSGGRE